MPHSRTRYCQSLFLRKLAFQRVVLVQGVRQCGKSFFLRDLYAKKNAESIYVTLDQPSEKKFAQDNPESFLQRLREYRPVIIDETQKVSDLFDMVKFLVDQDQRPGQFVLAGSTEFSIKSGIRESLTGRASTLRMFPLTMAEALEFPQNEVKFLKQKTSKVSRAQFMRHLERGGMPGIFAVHSETERKDLMKDWIELTVHRDLFQIPGPKKDPALALDILQKVAELEEPTKAEIAKALRTDQRKIHSHLDALKTLFVLNEIPASEFGTGKSRFYLCDASFAGYFEASFKRCLETLFLQELLAIQAFSLISPFDKLSYYRTSKGSTIDFMFRETKQSWTCLKIHDRESINELDVRIMHALKEKYPSEDFKMVCAAGVSSARNLDEVEILPWEIITSI